MTNNYQDLLSLFQSYFNIASYLNGNITEVPTGINSFDINTVSKNLNNVATFMDSVVSQPTFNSDILDVSYTIINQNKAAIDSVTTQQNPSQTILQLSKIQTQNLLSSFGFPLNIEYPEVVEKEILSILVTNWQIKGTLNSVSNMVSIISQGNEVNVDELYFIKYFIDQPNIIQNISTNIKGFNIPFLSICQKTFNYDIEYNSISYPGSTFIVPPSDSLIFMGFSYITNYNIPGTVGSLEKKFLPYNFVIDQHWWLNEDALLTTYPYSKAMSPYFVVENIMDVDKTIIGIVELKYQISQQLLLLLSGNTSDYNKFISLRNITIDKYNISLNLMEFWYVMQYIWSILSNIDYNNFANPKLSNYVYIGQNSIEEINKQLDFYYNTRFDNTSLDLIKILNIYDSIKNIEIKTQNVLVYKDNTMEGSSLILNNLINCNILSNGNKLLIFGGLLNNKSTDQLTIIDNKNLTVETTINTGIFLENPSVIKCKQSLIIFGGIISDPNSILYNTLNTTTFLISTFNYYNYYNYIIKLNQNIINSTTMLDLFSTNNILEKITTNSTIINDSEVFLYGKHYHNLNTIYSQYWINTELDNSENIYITADSSTNCNITIYNIKTNLSYEVIGNLNNIKNFNTISLTNINNVGFLLYEDINNNWRIFSIKNNTLTEITNIYLTELSNNDKIILLNTVSNNNFLEYLKTLCSNKIINITQTNLNDLNNQFGRILTLLPIGDNNIPMIISTKNQYNNIVLNSNYGYQYNFENENTNIFVTKWENDINSINIYQENLQYEDNFKSARLYRDLLLKSRRSEFIKPESIIPTFSNITELEQFINISQPTILNHIKSDPNLISTFYSIIDQASRQFEKTSFVMTDLSYFNNIIKNIINIFKPIQSRPIILPELSFSDPVGNWLAFSESTYFSFIKTLYSNILLNDIITTYINRKIKETLSFGNFIENTVNINNNNICNINSNFINEVYTNFSNFN